MTAVRHNPLIFYVLLAATFVMAYGVIWSVLSLNAVSVVVALVGTAIVYFTGRRVCQ
jgi:hypothetical protein